MSTTIPFSLLTAFSNEVNGGNPAAVVFMDLDFSADTYENIALNLNQPITAFVSPEPIPSSNMKTVALHIRWFTSTRKEVPLCGHGTLAAAKAVLEREDLVTEATEVIEFHTLTRGVMTARKCDGGFTEIQLPSAYPVEVSPGENVRLSKILYRAFGREVAINYIASGGEGYEYCMMVELDEREDLKNLSVDAGPLRDSGFNIHIITTVSSSGDEQFVSRMFAPGYVPNNEDHVCGTAHCLMVPHWSRKLGIHGGQEIKAKQVSARGGDLKLVWDPENRLIRLMGQIAVLAKGELRL